MNYNIVQDFLINKRLFQLQSKPIVHYSKKLEVVPNFTANLIIVFKDYDITFGKYLYFGDYCCFALEPEETHNCKNVTDLFKLIKVFDSLISPEKLQEQLISYKNIIINKISTLSQDNNNLLTKLSAAQRSLGIFARTSSDYGAVANKANNLQNSVTRNQREIDVLNQVLSSLISLTT
jgi:hypothetical protein